MPRPIRLLQANLNHSARAQDLFLQALAEWQIGLAVAAEPYYVPARANWLGDNDGSVAIVATAAANAPPLSLVGRGDGFVAAELGGTTVVGVYYSPNRSLAAFEAFLGEVGAVVHRSSPNPVLVLGDLNAKSLAWGSPRTDQRGEAVGEWAAETGLLVLNRGSVHTCVRQRGGSIVDVSFATPAVARMVRDWRVLEGVETLSDHRYIRIDVSTPQTVPDHTRRPRSTPPPRWTLKRLNKDALMEASIIQAWLDPPAGPVEVAEETSWFGAAMTQVCDASMPRARRQPQARREVYWWSSDIASLWEACGVVRRRYTRYRRRRCRDGSIEAELYGAYREAKKSLQLAISRAKAQAWEELLGALDRDPWGRPYRIVRNKLRTWAPPVTESLHPRVLEDVVAALFPGSAEETTPPARASPAPVWSGEPSPGVPPVTREELAGAVKRLGAKNVAPGPDGIPGKAWVMALSVLGDRLRRLYTGCLSTGWFPPAWKTGRLVLLRKEGRPAESPSAYRPICLLDEVGKLFERVLASRLVEHLTRVGPDLADCQFGFREGRSTIDAIRRVKALSEQAVSRGGVALAVSLDIANAFNTLPWARIREALRYHGVPPYLERILGAYLSQRYIVYQGRYGESHRRETRSGVPQGSVLGPLLWNLGYNWVLRGALLPGLSVVCYADDTLVMARGDTEDETARLARRGVAIVVGRVRALGLEVALHKTEAIWFCGPRRRPPPLSHLECGGSRVEIKPTITYLGLVLDNRWSFRAHFDRLAPRVMGAVGALSRLLPNLGGPGEGCRRLYMGTVRSMALYGAPVWACALTANMAALAPMRKAQRAMAVRVIRGYRTVSYEAACVLAGSPPWDLVAGSHASTYEWRVGLRAQGVRPTPKAVEARRLHARRLVLLQWKGRLAQPRAGLRAVGAIQPILEEWVNRRWGQLTFRLVQVLSGHGCFGEYLHKIAGREPTAMCHQCGGDQDTAQHTLEVCPAWAEQRRVLVAEVGRDLSLPAVVSAMVGSEGSWAAMASFCEETISQKEAAERGREGDPASLPLRRGKGGARRRAFGRRLLA